MFHAAIDLFGLLHHLIQVVVQTGAKAHFAGDLAQPVEALAHGLEGGVVEMGAVGRKTDQPVGSETLEEFHGLAAVGQVTVLLGGIVGRVR